MKMKKKKVIIATDKTLEPWGITIPVAQAKDCHMVVCPNENVIPKEVKREMRLFRLEIRAKQLLEKIEYTNICLTPQEIGDIYCFNRNKFKRNV